MQVLGPRVTAHTCPWPLLKTKGHFSQDEVPQDPYGGREQVAWELESTVPSARDTRSLPSCISVAFDVVQVVFLRVLRFSHLHSGTVKVDLSTPSLTLGDCGSPPLLFFN